MARIIGIDFGTSTTVVKYMDEGDNDVKVVTDADGGSVIPSAVYRTPEGKYAFGCEAITLHDYSELYKCDDNVETGEFFTNFKMDLLDQQNSQKREKAEELIALFFKEHIIKLIQKTIPDLHYKEYVLALSFPAKWTPGMSDAIERIAKNAGFNATAIIRKNEPTAAVLNMIYKHKLHLTESGILKVNKPIHIFMLDMGAGTTDIAIFRFMVDENGKYTVDNLFPYPSIDNPYLCGGREIDDILYNYVQECFKRCGVEFEFSKQFIKEWKDTLLSECLKHNLTINKLPNGIACNLPKEDFARLTQIFYIDRSVFEAKTCDHWRNLYKLIESSVKEYKRLYNKGAEDIDLLCLTGGHSKWYTVENLFNGEGVFGSIGKVYSNDGSYLQNVIKFEKLIKEPYRIEKFLDSKPQECVANGLCYYRNKHIDVYTTSANNIWVQLVINNVESEILEVVNYGQILPCTKVANINLGIITKDYQSDLNNEFRGFVKVFSGKDFNADRFDRIDIDLCLGLFEYMFGGSKYDVKFNCEFTVEDNNSMGVKGDVVFKSQSAFYAPRKVVSFNKR